MTDPRADLERLPTEVLYSIARTECAQHRVPAIRLLVERGSRLALQPDIVDEVRALKLKDPAVLPPGEIDIYAGKLDINGQIAALRAKHAKDRTAVERRLALLERSAWRKLMDYLRASNKTLLPDEMPPRQEGLS